MGTIWLIDIYTVVSRIKCGEVVLLQCRDNGTFAEFKCSEHKGAGPFLISSERAYLSTPILRFEYLGSIGARKCHDWG